MYYINTKWHGSLKENPDWMGANIMATSSPVVGRKFHCEAMLPAGGSDHDVTTTSILWYSNIGTSPSSSMLFPRCGRRTWTNGSPPPFRAAPSPSTTSMSPQWPHRMWASTSLGRNGPRWGCVKLANYLTGEEHPFTSFFLNMILMVTGTGFLPISRSSKSDSYPRIRIIG